MNRNYKVIWNRSLGCFTAVAEYAKSRGKSSSTVSSTSIASAAVSSGAKLLRLSALSVGLVTAGLSISPQVFAFTGDGGTAAGSNAIAIGGLSTTARAGNQGSQSVAIGYDAQVSGDQSVGLGANVRATGNSSIAIGGDDLDSASRTNQNGTLATDLNGGDINTIFKKYSGRDLVDTNNRYPSTSSSGTASVAIGVQAVASGGLSTAFGTQTKASGAASSAFGVSASATKEGSVAIGAGSKTDGSASKVQAATVNGVEFTGFVGNASFAGTAADAGRQVSVGLIGNERQIKNVAPGELSATSTDAINGSQIYAVSSKLIDNIQAVKTTSDDKTNALGNSTATNLGGSATYNTTTGVVSAPEYKLNNNATTVNNVGAALTNIDGRTTTNTTNITGLQNQTFKIQANSDAASAVKSSDTVKFINGKNVNITRSGNDITIGTSATPEFTTVTSTGAMTAGSLNTSGDLTVAGVSNLNGGANLNNNKITGLAKGTNATDAVNFSQLAESELTSSVVAGNNTSVSSATTGNNTAYTVNAKKSTVSAGSTAVAVTPGTETNDTTNYAVDLSAATKTSLGKADTAVQTISSNDSNLTAVKTGNNVTFDFADAPVFTGQVKASGFDASGAKIINVVDGSVAANSKDAINGGQLFNTADSVTSIIGGNASNTNGVISATDIGGTGQDNINDAISNVKGAATAAKTTVTQGENILVTETIDQTTGASNYEVKTKRDLALDSVTTGNSVLNNDGVTITDGSNITAVSSTGTSVTDGTSTSNYGAEGFTITGGPSVTGAGINAGNKKITNVDNGSVVSGSKDAINGGQLFNTADSVTSIIGGNA
ncbi:ESPR-type extended signal peptide-containing protein, partial [uncultured Psychrobacter sp.]|uniref:ESPR-type extended signal peptide-containing protein n=1 Tax=uncultured Psychrobacter sp. TaxID=259303 RepID=UPI0025936490